LSRRQIDTVTGGDAHPVKVVVTVAAVRRGGLRVSHWWRHIATAPNTY